MRPNLRHRVIRAIAAVVDHFRAKKLLEKFAVSMIAITAKLERGYPKGLVLISVILRL